ncbi:MAG: ATP-binding protein, partial [Desulfobacula sp.]|nr:ATP-binding protein [Desulfobacula sp.]
LESIAGKAHALRLKVASSSTGTGVARGAGEPGVTDEAIAEMSLTIGQIRLDLEALAGEADVAVLDAHARGRTVLSRAVLILSGVSLLAALLAVFSGMLQYRAVVPPLARMRDRVREIASGRFDQRVTHCGKDEFADLAADFNRMVAELESLYHNLEERVETKSRQLVRSERLASVGYLAAGMAHEINNPLAGMMQNAQVIFNRMTLDIPANTDAAREVGIRFKDIRAYMEKRDILHKLDLINSSGNRAARIVKNMLSFARKSDTIMESINLSKLLKKTIELARSDYNLKKRYDFKRIDIIEDYNPDIPHVLCDPGKIQQVFLNIFKNGAQAMFAIDTDPDAPAAHCFKLKVYKEEKKVCVHMEDNGPGLDEEHKKRLFEPFYTTKPVGEGTGLGLSVSYFIIVDDHKGEMQVESSPGKGTTFIIKLPV